MTDPFAPDLTESPEALEFLTLEDLNRMVSNVLRDAFSTPLWVLAEVSEVRAHTNGFCYLTLVQKKERSQTPCARASALIMPFTYPLLRSRFISQTGTDLAPGMKLLAQVKVEFHVSFGYQLQIVDIDPSYTLGDVARRRREIIAALEADGVMELNKSLFLPRLLSRIAIVSSPTAAGYEDFLNQLSHSPFGFRTKLFPAIMQGERVEESIVGALDAIAAEADAWDVVVIIRGGGATSDLSGFDSYELASNVAQFPLPVLTGIGHERDDTVIDLVAHTRLKTPTAVAVFLIDSRRREADALEDLCQRLLNRARFPLEQAKGQLGTLRLRLSKSVMPLMVAHHNALWRAKNLTRIIDSLAPLRERTFSIVFQPCGTACRNSVSPPAPVVRERRCVCSVWSSAFSRLFAAAWNMSKNAFASPSVKWRWQVRKGCSNWASPSQLAEERSCVRHPN